MASGLRAAVVNATTPTGATAGAAGVQSLGFSTSAAMKVRLNSTSSTATTPGTELPNGGGYVTGGQAFTESQSAIASPANLISLPAVTALSWTNSSGSPWTIQSMDLTDSTGTRAWWGDFTGAPVTVNIGNIFQIAASGVTVSAT
jgi:hypothetical protein